jgi:uncharacterized membrane protein
MTSSEPPDPGDAEEPAGQSAVPRWPGTGRRGPDPWLTWLRKAEHLAAGHVPDLPVPAWLRPTRGERRWPLTASIAAAIVLQILLPPHLSDLLPQWLMPALEGALLVGVTVADPVRVERDSTALRAASIVQIILITIANAASAVLLIQAILDGKAGTSAEPLFATGASIWLTNVIAFGLWYWEFDRGGPIRRTAGTMPHFFDYLYMSFTNATAFSPTDVMPLARWAKATMLVQSAVSLAIGALVIARAVNILRT